MTADQKALEWNDDRSPVDLSDALNERDKEAVDVLLAALRRKCETSAVPVSSGTALDVLKQLGKYGCFDEMRDVSPLLANPTRPEILVQLRTAQGEIDGGGDLDKVIAGLEAILEKHQPVHEELLANGARAADVNAAEYRLSETLGMLGRAHKQRFVHAVAKEGASADRSDFKRARGYYNRGSDLHRGRSDSMWHRINALGLSAMAETLDRSPGQTVLDFSDDVRCMANDIRSEIEDSEDGGLGKYDWANYAEASLAMGQADDAVLAIRAYLENSSAFEVQSTRRQLLEIWRLDPTKHPGNQIFALIDGQLAKTGVGLKSMSIPPERLSQLEKVQIEITDLFETKGSEWLRRNVARAIATDPDRVGSVETESRPETEPEETGFRPEKVLGKSGPKP
ncbi:MAG: tetratricopeptide repeat-containing protein, partial [Pseudomonadota bacterium]